MARPIYFLLAILAVFAMGAAALSARSCAGRRVPDFIDPRLSLEEAALRSEQSGRPVFVLVGADWCPHCERLKRGALADDRVVAWIRERTEPVYVDATRARSRDPQTMALMDRLKVNHLPAMILLKKGVQLGHAEGNLSAPEFLAWADQAAPR